MPVWIIAAAIASIVITALLTFALWRMNAPALEQARKDAAQNGGGDAGFVPASSRSGDQRDTSDDGGGDGGGGE